MAVLTTIVTFLTVFLIHATQNRDTLALQLKRDELILATEAAGNHIAGIDETSDEDIKKATSVMCDSGSRDGRRHRTK